MPIDKKSESLDWEALVRRTLKRAKNCCMRCLKPDKRVVHIAYRDGLQYWIKQGPTGLVWRNEFGELEIANPPTSIESEPIEVVLSIIHLNHNSGDNRDKNLQVFCQSCVVAHENQRLRDLQAVTTVSGVAAAESELKPYLIHNNEHRRPALQGNDNNASLTSPTNDAGLTGTVAATAQGPLQANPPNPNLTGYLACSHCGTLATVGDQGALWVFSTGTKPVEPRSLSLEKGMRVSVLRTGPPAFLIFGAAGASALLEEICRINELYSVHFTPPPPPHLLVEVLRYQDMATRVALIRFEAPGVTRMLVLEVKGSWYDLHRQPLNIIPVQ